MFERNFLLFRKIKFWFVLKEDLGSETFAWIVYCFTSHNGKPILWWFKLKSYYLNSILWQYMSVIYAVIMHVLKFICFPFQSVKSHATIGQLLQLVSVFDDSVLLTLFIVLNCYIKLLVVEEIIIFCFQLNIMQNYIEQP